MENKKMVTDGVYFHINNGGVSFKVTNDDYLAIEVQAGHFGNITNHIKLYVSPEGLKQLGQMFVDASTCEANICEWLRLESNLTDKDTGRIIAEENVQNDYCLSQDTLS